MNPGNDDNRTAWTAWQQACAMLGVPVDEARRRTFEQLYSALAEANQTTNLTRITALSDFLERHLLDSLSVAPLIPENAAIIDVGSGAGFPAIPLAVVRPDLRVTAVESVGKKCQFMQAMQEQLGLSNFRVIHDRSEALGQDKTHREKYDAAVARAVTALPALLELCLPLVKVKGRFLAMKGLSYEPELAAAAKALKMLGGRLAEVREFPHPALSGSRVLVFDKTAPTPGTYPRQPGLPVKKPL